MLLLLLLLETSFSLQKASFPHLLVPCVCVSSRSCCCCCCCCATSNRSRFLYQRRYFSLHLLCCSSSSCFSLDFYLFASACFTSLYSVGRDAVAVCCYFPDIVFPLLLPLSLVVFSFAFVVVVVVDVVSHMFTLHTSLKICLIFVLYFVYRFLCLVFVIVAPSLSAPLLLLLLLMLCCCFCVAQFSCSLFFLCSADLSGSPGLCKIRSRKSRHRRREELYS